MEPPDEEPNPAGQAFELFLPAVVPPSPPLAVAVKVSIVRVEAFPVPPELGAVAELAAPPVPIVT